MQDFSSMKNPMHTHGDRKGNVRMLVVSSDTFPPTRVDVAVLFAEELAERRHHFDWLMQSEDPCDRS